MRTLLQSALALSVLLLAIALLVRVRRSGEEGERDEIGLAGIAIYVVFGIALSIAVIAALATIFDIASF